MSENLHPMLIEIFQLAKPSNFEVKNINEIVLKFFPVNLSKNDIIQKINNIPQFQYKEESPNQIYAKYLTGEAMYDVNAYVITIVFKFNNGVLSTLNAEYHKNQ